MILVLPALYLSAILIVYVVPVEGYDAATDEYYGFLFVSGVAFVVSSLAWFSCLVLGRMPTGFRDLLAYALRYGAQTWGYLLFLTDRYPDADTDEPAATQPTPAQANASSAKIGSSRRPWKARSGTMKIGRGVMNRAKVE